MDAGKSATNRVTMDESESAKKVDKRSRHNRRVTADLTRRGGRGREEDEEEEEEEEERDESPQMLCRSDDGGGWRQ
jgi:hypothetical protein